VKGLPEPQRRRWQERFSEWFDWVLERAEVYDYGRYPVKGMGVWMPYGFSIRRNVLELLRRLLDGTGHDEVLFPLLIPDFLLAKEGEHIKGFEDEVYWVTRGGLEELDQKLALRPTSETPITYYESLWIQSYKQLPRKFYQVVSVFRYETKATRPLIRVREISMFKEAHTVHESFEDAERQVMEAIDVYKKFFDSLGISYVISRRPDWDKFAGALYTIAFDTVLPDGRTLQIGTVHNLGQNFTKAFSFRIHTRDEKYDYPWQTSYGVSDRVVATLIAVHGDDMGLVLPSNIAPTQAIIIPIPSQSEDEMRKVLEYSRRALSTLLEAGIRAKLDDRSDTTPGDKYYYWDAKGVPVRVEVGPREAASETLTLVRRDTLRRTSVHLREAAEAVKKLLSEIDSNLAERARKFMSSHITRASSIEEARKAIEERKGIVELPWCGSEECANKVMQELNVKTLGTPWPPERAEGVCPVCGRPAVTYMRYSRQY
jgi:prolyl-tRNA synthetase